MKRIIAFIALASLAALLATCHLRGAGAPEDDAGAPSVEERAEEAVEELVEQQSPQARWLDDRLFEIGSAFDGYLGIAVVDVASGTTIDFNGDEAFPQQSVSKLWVALTAFDLADAGSLDLEETATVRFDDLTVFHQPIRRRVVASGSFTASYDEFIERALTQSDNTANDMVLRRVGGPDAVRATLADRDLAGIRFGPGERIMQSAIAGLEWNQRYALDKTFFEVRDEVPDDVRARAFNAYVEDPVDAAQPIGVARALAALARGELLSDRNTQRFLQLLGEVKSGPNRLKGGVPPAWSIVHKTGTGQVFDPKPVGGPADQAGYNDVGILTAPDGSRYAVG